MEAESLFLVDGMGKCQSLRRKDQGRKREREKAMGPKKPDVIMQS
jgi:hypothetical protein